MAHNYKELEVWKRAMSIAKSIYTLTKKFPIDEKFGLTSQIQRAAVSIASNIAEGAGRGTDKDFVHFLNIALGSAFEVETQVLLSLDLGYLSNEDSKDVLDNIRVIQPQLNALIKKYGEIII